MLWLLLVILLIVLIVSVSRRGAKKLKCSLKKWATERKLRPTSLPHLTTNHTTHCPAEHYSSALLAYGAGVAGVNSTSL